MQHPPVPYFVHIIKCLFKLKKKRESNTARRRHKKTAPRNRKRRPRNTKRERSGYTERKRREVLM